MTGADLAAGGRLIQIGLAFGTGPGEWIAERIGWDPGDYAADPRAMAVHGISEQEIRDAPRAEVVDRRLYEWCRAHGGTPEKRRLVAVGFNVGAFDLPFVRDALPETSRLLSRRSVDLNAVCFLLAGTLVHGGSRPSWTGWRRLAKRAAEARLAGEGIEPAWHDAGYDALASLVAFEWLRARVAGVRGGG